MLRRATQVGTVGFIAYAALNGPWRNFKVAHNLDRLVALMHGETWGDLYRWNEQALSLWGEPLRASYDFMGMPWAAVVAGVPIVDPLLVAGQVVGVGQAPLSLLLSAALPLLVAVLFGRVFCSHICPMRLAFELGQLVRGGLLYVGIPLPAIRPSDRFGGWVLVGGLLATVAAGPVVWLVLLPYAGAGAGLFLGITAGATGGLLVVPAFLLAVDALVSPGTFCRSLCPTGFLLGAVGRFAPLRVRKTDSACPGGCHACERACPYGLSPKALALDGCDRCGVCVVACPDARLSRGLVLGRVVRPEELAA